MIIEKVVAPENISNKEPYGTKWYALMEHGTEVWIQTSPDQEKPKWCRLGDLYETYHMENKLFEPEWFKKFGNIESDESVIAIRKGDNQ